MSEGYPFWSGAELEELIATARERFVERYRSEIRTSFLEVEKDCAEEVRELFDATDYLRTLGKDPDFFRSRRDLLKAARYTTSPVISEGTLKVVGEAARPEEIIREFVDVSRFPWLSEDRRPVAGSAEVGRAVEMTAKLMAEQRLATKLRNSLSTTQERSVRERLEAAGFGADLHTAAVLGGVFKLINLTAAQEDGILIFFDHDLPALDRFLRSGARPRQRPRRAS